MASLVPPPRRSEVLSLFRFLLRTSRKFTDYNIREFAKRRTVDAFRHIKDLSDPSAIAAAFCEGKTQLEVATRQSVVYSLYVPKVKSIMEIVYEDQTSTQNGTFSSYFGLGLVAPQWQKYQHNDRSMKKHCVVGQQLEVAKGQLGQIRVVYSRWGMSHLQELDSRVQTLKVRGHMNGVKTLPHSAAITTVDWHPSLPILWFLRNCKKL